MSLAHTPLRQIAAEHPAALSIFDRFEIDLCRLGDRSLAEACATLRISADQVEEKITGLLTFPRALVDPQHLTLAQLIQRIVRVHHRRVRHDLPALADMAARLDQAHSTNRPEHSALARLVAELHREMFAHIGREEQVLFPFIARMEEESRLNYPTEHGCFRTLQTPISRMLQDHDTAGHILDELRLRTNDFHPPEDACGTKRALFAGLESFDADTREHIHLENDFLFPRAIALEAAIAKKIQPKSGNLS
jgi:regulator of cell morphogenesis and NO signaling